MTRSGRRRKSQRGNAMVELALASAVLVPLFTGTFAFGYGLFQYNKVATNVRSAARYAALRTYDSSTATPSSAFTTAVRNVAVYGNPEGTGSPVIQSLTPAQVGVSVTMVSGVPDTVTVGVSEFHINAVLREFRMPGKPAARFRYVGRFAP